MLAQNPLEFLSMPADESVISIVMMAVVALYVIITTTCDWVAARRRRADAEEPVERTLEQHYGELREVHVLLGADELAADATRWMLFNDWELPNLEWIVWLTPEERVKLAQLGMNPRTLHERIPIKALAFERWTEHDKAEEDAREKDARQIEAYQRSRQLQEENRKKLGAGRTMATGGVYGDDGRIQDPRDPFEREHERMRQDLMRSLSVPPPQFKDEELPCYRCDLKPEVWKPGRPTPEAQRMRESCPRCEQDDRPWT